MASRTRADLLQAQSELNRISSELRWKQEREEREQEARNLLFKIKKQLLAIEKALPDEAAALALLQTRDHFFVLNKRLAVDSFSSLSDKEYFDATTALIEELRQRSEDLIGPEKWGALVNYHVFILFEEHYRSLYFLLRAKELRESDEKLQGMVGRLFSSLTSDKTKSEIGIVARRFGRDEQINKFRKRIPSSTVKQWIEEEKKTARVKLGDTLEWLDFENAFECLEFFSLRIRAIEMVGQEYGFNAHESFCSAVHEESRERGLPLPVSKEYASVSIETLPTSVSIDEFLNPQADPNLLANIRLLDGVTERGPYTARRACMWYYAVDELNSKEARALHYRTNAMPEWRPLSEYFDQVLIVNIWISDSGQQFGPIHAIAVYEKKVDSEIGDQSLYRTENMSAWRPVQELIEKIREAWTL